MSRVELRAVQLVEISHQPTTLETRPSFIFIKEQIICDREKTQKSTYCDTKWVFIWSNTDWEMIIFSSNTDC
jgi:hypothetical protein